ncbi:MAG TPA: 16S rRNA (adenine(1518)-N(6)/adenine(1519)-N(6))-dimethyltransferase RsmA [Verrucomicrobiae bacterium]|jgi:16S rRNA (adenine1518-N6/adenine1519-N6)-dimethyltransferase|nr:16S rRNA (adenine(1518)-N(6)/adenine(1519)-N(6))-dimethyltransferase RsmA [Verrucomicrobiae bacterium]
MKLSEMRELLGSRGIQLTKSLGQIFLHDQNQIQKIIALGGVNAGDKVLEIGPGLGPLTESLLRSGAHVLAIEKDARLCEVLRDRWSANFNFELLHADALEFLKKTERDWTDWKLISNLPYSVGSPILVELALAARPPRVIVATLQLEVVQRIAASAADGHYGQLSLFMQLRYEPREWFKIPSGSFFPPPDVDSACVLLCRRERELIGAELVPLFQRVVKLAFSERRKMMAKLLKRQWPTERVDAALNNLGISPQARAETLSLDQFVALAKDLG